MAAAIFRMMNAVRSSSRTLLSDRSTSPLSSLSKRFISSLQRPHPLPVRFQPAIPLSSWLNQVRFMVNRAHNDYTPLSPSSGFGPHFSVTPLFPGCDYMHWLIVMDNPGGVGASKEEMIDCYIKTLAQIVGSEQEAIKRIYNVKCGKKFSGFGCEIDKEMSDMLAELPDVLYVTPDNYAVPENKDYVEGKGLCWWRNSSENA